MVGWRYTAPETVGAPTEHHRANVLGKDQTGWSCLQLGGKDTSLRALGFVGSRILNSKPSRIPKPDDMIKNCSEVVWYIKKIP